MSGPVAILGDVHGYVHNLDRALAECERRGATRIWFLGDAVGYGRFPNETVERLAGHPAMARIAGNHDRMAIGRYSRLTCSARGRHSTRLTRRLLTDDTRRFLADLPDAHREGDRLAVHASLFRIDDYLLGEQDIARNRAALAGPAAPTRVFYGHTHRADFWEIDPEGGIVRGKPEGTTRLRPDRTYFVNPGAVGDLRAGDERFSFVLLLGDELEWVRLDSTNDAFPELARSRHPALKWLDRQRMRAFRKLFKLTGHGAVKLPT